MVGSKELPMVAKLDYTRVAWMVLTMVHHSETPTAVQMESLMDMLWVVLMV